MGDKEYPPLFDNENRKIRLEAFYNETNERLDSLERRIENLEEAKGPGGAETADALHAVTMARDYAELDRMHVANARRNAAQRSGAAKTAFEAEAWERSAQAWEAVADTYGGTP